MKHKAENYFGWYGVLAILMAYLLVSFNIVAANSFTYQVFNLSGAFGIIIEAASKKDAQPAVLNAVWAIIAIVAIVRLVMR